MTGGTWTAERTPQGLLISDRQHNVASPHPHPDQGGRLVPTTGLNLVMLEDGTTLYECDECGQLREKSLSVISHMTSHNTSKGAPNYDIKTLRQLVALATNWKELHVRGFAEKTARELNDLGYVTLQGDAWTANHVSRLFAKWKSDPRMRVRRATKRAEPKTPAPWPSTPELRARTQADLIVPTDERVRSIFQDIRNAREIIITVAGRLDDLSHELGELAVGQQIDPTELKLLREKAQRWDDLRASLR
jgi:hypothetical protein